MSCSGLSTVLSPLIEQGAGLLLGTSDHQGVPRATRAWGARALGPTVLRVTFSADDPVVVDNVRRGVVAITSADVRTLRSAQIKGRVLRVEPPTEDDLDVAAAQTDDFFRAVHEVDGNDLDLLRRLLPTKMLSVDVELSEGFDQTPGPAAGDALPPTSTGLPS